MLIFAEVDPTMTSIGGAGLVGFCIWVVRYLASERDKQREHEVKMQERHETLTEKCNETFTAIQKDSVNEARKTTNTLLNIQEKTVTAISALGQKVETLGTAIDEMRTQLSTKQDKAERPDREFAG